MADLQTINIGNLVNDGLGDDLRTAFLKVNANFADLNDELTITASNVGATGAGIFKQKVDSNLEFKTLVSGRKMQLDEGENTIVINNLAPDAFTRFEAGSGSWEATSGSTSVLFQGTEDIVTSIFGSTVNIATAIPVTKILTIYDFGPLNGQYTNSVQLAMQSANIDFGTITYEGRIDVDCGRLTSS